MSSGLSDAERINLKKMINESECGDNTDNIRKLKHSVLMRDDIRKIDTLKNTHPDMKMNENDKFVELCRSEAPFLFSNYTDIFNKLVSDELDMTIMTQFLTILKMIEDETITGGMIPKINTCLDAVNNGVTGVVIVDGRKPHSILFEIFSDKGAGTLIRK